MKLVLNMKKAITVIAASLSVNAIAQTQTSTVTATEAGTTLSKFTGSFLALGHFNINDVNTKTGAHADEYQYRLGYKITEDTKVGILGAFLYNKVAVGSDAAQTDVDYYDSALTATTKTGGILGSEPLSLDFRMYVPTSRSAVYAPVATRQTTLRFDTSINYQITPKIIAGVAFSPRHTIVREGANLTRMITMPSVSYNFTDALSTYFAVNDDFKFLSDAKNTMTLHEMGPEVGVNYTASKNIDLALMVSQARNALNPSESDEKTGVAPRSEFSMFYAKETEYQLQGVMHF
jgi:hypothetical protein